MDQAFGISEICATAIVEGDSDTYLNHLDPNVNYMRYMNVEYTVGFHRRGEGGRKMRIKLTLSAFWSFALVFSMATACNEGGQPGENHNNNNDPCSNRECGEAAVFLLTEIG